MTHSPLTTSIRLSAQSSSRDGRRIDRFIVHHAASTSHDGVVDMMVRETREVSANYVVSERITCVVDEDRRAWTSASAAWDGRAITVETINSAAGGSWPVSDKTFDNLARLIADVARRYDFPINDSTILTHQELYTRHGASYATSCPGDLQRRKAELIALANKYRAGKTTGGIPAPAPAPAAGVTGWARSGGIAVPRGPLMARIQRALKARGRYAGPTDGIAGPETIKGIQRTITVGTDYDGPIDGELGPNGATYIQEYAARYGDYTGPIDGDPLAASWTGLALGLERP